MRPPDCDFGLPCGLYTLLITALPEPTPGMLTLLAGTLHQGNILILYNYLTDVGLILDFIHTTPFCNLCLPCPF
jgi:hypothetical protein